MTFTLVGPRDAAPPRVAPPSTDGNHTHEPPFPDTRIVAFDLDCTLVDIIRIKQRACEAAAWTLADAGLDLEPELAAADLMETARAVGIDRDDVVDHYLRRVLGEPQADLVRRARRAFEEAEDAAVVAYPRAERTLAELDRRGYGLALVSDAPRHRVARRLGAAGLAGIFDPVLAFEDTPRGKADPTPFARLAARTGARPHEILMVGDNPKRDVGNARAFGCRTVLAAYGLQDAFASDHPAHAPDRTIRWLDELLTLLPERPSRDP